jgi:hypothetical protein
MTSSIRSGGNFYSGQRMQAIDSDQLPNVMLHPGWKQSCLPF